MVGIHHPEVHPEVHPEAYREAKGHFLAQKVDFLEENQPISPLQPGKVVLALIPGYSRLFPVIPG